MTSLLLLIRGRSPRYGIFSPSGCNCFRCGNDDSTHSLVINASCEMSVESIDTLSNRGSPAVEERSHHFTLVSIALSVVIAARIVRSGSMRILARILALVTLASIMATIFGAELLDPIGVPGILFPFGIGVSRSQYIYAIVIPLVAFLIVRTLFSKGTRHEASPRKIFIDSSAVQS